MLRIVLLLFSLTLTGCSAMNPNTPINKQTGTSVVRYPADGGGPEGSLCSGSFEVGGQTVRCHDSPIKHAFEFTPSVSLFVDCESEAEIDRLCEALAEAGEFLMPPGDYGFSTKFAWVKDRYGVSWQLNLPSQDA